jgi:multidrug efflux pump subunit AcrA (membrane-fusion protein)
MRRSLHLYLLAAGAIALAILSATAIGSPASSSRTSQETVTAEPGVVQTTVQGTGNVEAGTDVIANFQTSGTLAAVYVHVGQHVIGGQLLAELDPTTEQLAVDQAQENLTAAEDQLTALENGTATTGSSGSGANGSGGSGASGSGGSGANGSGSGGATSTAAELTGSHTEFVTETTSLPASHRRKPTKGPGSGTTTTTTTSAPTQTTTPPRRSATTPAPTTTAPTRTTSTTTTATAPAPPSPASLASAQANIDSAESALSSAELALAKTQLHAPATGTIISLASLVPGDSVSAGTSGSAASSSSSSGSGSSGAGAAGVASAAGGLGASGGSSSGGSGSSSSSSSSPFAEIVDTGTMTMTVAFSESDITKVRVGQTATVSIDALSGVELAAHVSSISATGTSSNGVVSYDATLTLDQTDPSVRPGMSASATVIVAQASGLTLPTQAVTGSGSLATVTLLRDGHASTQPVVVGLRGTSRVQIISGLTAGQQVQITITLPALGSTSTPGTGATGTFGAGRGFGGGGLGGGGFGGGGGFRALGGGGLGGG